LAACRRNEALRLPLVATRATRVRRVAPGWAWRENMDISFGASATIGLGIGVR
jgi:hypothetical protein